MKKLKKQIIRSVLLFIVLIFYFQNGYAQEKVVYKTVDTLSLSMEIYYPKDLEQGKKYPTMIFFSGAAGLQGIWGNSFLTRNTFREGE